MGAESRPETGAFIDDHESYLNSGWLNQIVTRRTTRTGWLGQGGGMGTQSIEPTKREIIRSTLAPRAIKIVGNSGSPNSVKTVQAS